MLKKVFFIIEENDDMYIQGLDNICVYYKRSNLKDLQEKIEYYINNSSERETITNKCFNYIKDNFNMDSLMKKIITI